MPHTDASIRTPLLEVRDLSAHYGRIQALRSVSLHIDEGELVALVGNNGAGKSTLLHTICGVQPASGGEITFAGANITKTPSAQRVRMGISQVPEARQVFGPMTVEDNLMMGAFTRKRREARVGIEMIYGLFPILAERRKQSAGTLSGGQQQMLAIGRGLMAKPRLLLLDEPSMGLAPRITDETFDIIHTLKKTGTTIFLIEQNASSALAIADRGYVLETGQVVLADEGQALLHNQKVQEAYLGM